MSPSLPIAPAIGEPARARMLSCLMDGHARTATELAIIAEVTPSTASVHLDRLKTAHLVKMLAQGKHRYYSLDGPNVARALEGLAVGEVRSNAGRRKGPGVAGHRCGGDARPAPALRARLSRLERAASASWGRAGRSVVEGLVETEMGGAGPRQPGLERHESWTA